MLPFASLIAGDLTCFDLDGNGTDDICAYPQKTESTWQPEWVDGSAAPVPVTVDWGDNLVNQTWTARSTIRVEIALTDLIDQTTADPVNAPDMTGYDMFYLAGRRPRNAGHGGTAVRQRRVRELRRRWAGRLQCRNQRRRTRHLRVHLELA
jgi:hypothetical protein